MKVRAFVLHLGRAKARRGNAQALLDACGLEGEIWPAVDGAELSEREVDAVYRRQLFTPHYPFTLRRGEVGCFLSHRQIWAEIQRRELDAALILEDDVALDHALFAPARDLGLAHITRFGYIKMCAKPPRGRATVIAQKNGVTLAQGQYPGLGTQGQLVSREGAARLLDHCQTFDRPVDTFVQSHWFTGLPPATIYPAGVTHADDELAGSTIQSARKSPLEKIRREVLRARYRIAARRAAAHSHAPQPNHPHQSHHE